MAKRKRDGSNAGQDARNLKKRPQKNGASVSGSLTRKGDSKESAVAPQTKQETKQRLDGIRIIVGSYEKVLCGIDVSIDWKSGTEKVSITAKCLN